MMTPPAPRVAYVDGSALIPMALGEQPVGDAVNQRLQRHPILISSNLLEAELRVEFRQAQLDFDHAMLDSIEWVVPNRPLDAEMEVIVEAANLGVARLWHLANAVYIHQQLGGLPMAFITLDEQQETVAIELGFAV